MIEIVIKNQKSQILASPRVLNLLWEETKIRAKGHFYSPAFRRGEWDGYVRYISPRLGFFETGLLDLMVNTLKNNKLKYTITDDREKFKDLHEVTEVGGRELKNKFIYQKEAIHAVLTNKSHGIKFIRGILYEATNAGKTVIAGGIVASFSKKRKTIFLVNSKTLFFQALNDFKEFFGEEEVGYVSSHIKKVKLARITICMVQTLGGRLKRSPELRRFLADTSIIIMDEADEVMNRKDAQLILANCHNAPIRLALTGTALMSKDKNRNRAQIKYFGPIIHSTTNRELVDRGVSSKPNIIFYGGNKKTYEKGDYTYAEAYEKFITKNRARNKKIWRIVKKKTKKGQVLVLFKYHKHAQTLMEAMRKYYPKMESRYKIEVIHHKVKNMENIIQKYNEGKIDILLASMVIRRGKNIPLIRSLINAAGGDSQENILQIFGRALRKLEGVKEEVDMIEFFDEGYYLKRHSKHRVIYYKNQKFEVRELYKKVVKKKTIK